MTTDAQFDDTTRCPLCAEPNECAVAAGQPVESCWCMQVTIAPEVIASVPSEAQGKVCICARCAGVTDADT